MKNHFAHFILLAGIASADVTNPPSSNAPQSAPNAVIRPLVENNHSIVLNTAGNAVAQGTGPIDPCVFAYNSAIFPLAGAPGSSASKLVEYSFGTPYTNFAQDVLNNGWTRSDGSFVPGILGQLYPSAFVRSVVEASSAPFRYKYLVYGPDPNAPAGTTPKIIDVFAASTNSSSWFNDNDRNVIISQIDILREALAFDPLNLELQDALLEIHYDWAVAELQFAKTDLANILKFRLGFQTIPALDSDPNNDSDAPASADGNRPPQTAIDLEIIEYEKLLTCLEKVLDVYLHLLEFESDGVNPSDFDSQAGGAPFGYYIFKTLQPFRNQLAPQYSSATGLQGLDTPQNGVPETVFNRYKDYRNLLTVLGNYYQFVADMSRLRGMRQGSGDVARAREALAKLSFYDARLFQKLEGMFADIDFSSAQYATSGVLAARSAIAPARSDAEGVRTFLNGTSNHLGLDPNFLLLFQFAANSQFQDSFDVFMEMLTDGGITFPSGPMAKARSDYGNPGNPFSGGGALQAFTNFRGNVDQVIEEFSNLEQNFNTEFVKLTGYLPDEVDPADPSKLAWQGGQHKIGVESDLKTAKTKIDALHDRNAILIQLTDQLVLDLADAQKAITLAKEIEGTITGAQAKYLDDTAGAWTEIHAWAGAAAAAQATYDGLVDVSSIDVGTQFFTGGSVGVAVGVAAGVNLAVQTTSAIRTSMREQEIEEAGVAMDITIATAGLPLAIQQQIIDFNDLYRESLSHRLEVLDNMAALNVAIAERNIILRDAKILQERFEIDYEVLATSYYADPIFFARAESAILAADRSFKEAQIWMFYACRALEHKYHQRWAWQGYDISSILTARNYPELENIRYAMESYDNNRTLNDGAPNDRRDIISLRDQIVTVSGNDKDLLFLNIPDPADTNNADEEGPGLRWKKDESLPGGGLYVPKEQFFREYLESNKVTVDLEGNSIPESYKITIDTTKIRRYGDFFRGPNFISLSSSPGTYRNKINWLAVNVVSSEAPTFLSTNQCSLIYSGNEWTRNRYPVCPTDRSQDFPAPDPTSDFQGIPGADEQDYENKGEYNVAPFTYFQQSSTFDLNQFDTFTARPASAANYLLSKDSLRNLSNGYLTEIVSGTQTGLQLTDFREYSTAVTRLTLYIEVGRLAPFFDGLKDIELVIDSRNYGRPLINCP